VAPITQKGNAMVPQFVPCPTPWALHIEYVLANRPGPLVKWEPENYPVIGWVYNDDRSGGPLVAWISYRGTPAPMADVLEDLRARALDKAKAQGNAAPSSLNYTLVPA
jgi:hypothetical protein